MFMYILFLLNIFITKRNIEWNYNSDTIPSKIDITGFSNLLILKFICYNYILI